MARYILIDSNSGYIWGDTADINGKIVQPKDICDAARLVDVSLGERDREYREVSRYDLSGATGYYVYRADNDDGWAIPLVEDSQDAETIADVERLCRYVGAVICERAS